METAWLSDYQLFELSRNQKLPSEIRIAVGQELISRQWTEDKIRMMELEQESRFCDFWNKRVSISYWILVGVFSFPFSLLAIIHIVIGDRVLSKARKRRWIWYWKYILLGCAVWRILGIIVGLL